MNKSQRQRIIGDLAKLHEAEFETFLAEVREARGVEAAGAEHLRKLLEGRAARQSAPADHTPRTALGALLGAAIGPDGMRTA